MPHPNVRQDGIIQVRFNKYWAGTTSPMHVLIDGQKVGSVMMSQTERYPTTSGDHFVQIRMFPNFSSDVVRVNIQPGVVIALTGSVKAHGFGIKLEFDALAPPTKDKPRVSVELLGIERVRAGVEDVSVPRGVTIRVNRSRTVEHSIEYVESGTTDGQLSAGWGEWLDISIRKTIERSVGKVMRESETVSYEIELNGVNATRYQLAWTDVWRIGKVTIAEGASSPFRVREGVELEVVPVQ